MPRQKAKAAVAAEPHPTPSAAPGVGAVEKNRGGAPARLVPPEAPVKLRCEYIERLDGDPVFWVDVNDETSVRTRIPLDSEEGLELVPGRTYFWEVGSRAVEPDAEAAARARRMADRFDALRQRIESRRVDVDPRSLTPD